ncbi:hypothetical protein EVAR_47799_1 [Eumeta japonica]|uniref:Uncharacterized protein n=1 Tax=Eumeta variegata TaxID=151549 RepID=A0A4C1ZAN4_EUMVA|nr:hypothetical protein EVAR_47799_1 [Eumeta japonica]
MSADVLSDDFKSRLHLKTKTVGQERIRRARENNEDVAILSMFLPNATAERENKKFCCALKEDCLLGDPRKTVAVFTVNQKINQVTLARVLSTLLFELSINFRIQVDKGIQYSQSIDSERNLLKPLGVDARPANAELVDDENLLCLETALAVIVMRPIGGAGVSLLSFRSGLWRKVSFDLYPDFTARPSEMADLKVEP